jgi:hypothetical protein
VTAKVEPLNVDRFEGEGIEVSSSSRLRFLPDEAVEGAISLWNSVAESFERAYARSWR